MVLVGDNDGQTCCGAKILFIFSLLSKRKCGSVSFNPARCQTGILSAPPQRLVSEYLRGHKRATCCSAIDCVKRVTVWVSACVRACVQGLC